MDALKLAEIGRQFDSVIDCGLYHVFSPENSAKYVGQLSHVVKPGGRLFLMCFSDDEPGEQGPRRVTQSEIRSTFAAGWEVESIREARFEVRPPRKQSGSFTCSRQVAPRSSISLITSP